ncbi:DNA helicase PcrA [Candidatus Peregrinibacteria bacterium]|nr:DNA helicase PcrA [Candidatus Peregrinibacteria bacterium]
MDDQNSSLLSSLNDMQKQVVLQTEGPVLVLAGAGSGKTAALTTRIAYLMMEKAVKPWNILAVTFTNKAANEMKMRVLRLLGQVDESYAPVLGTFHSICVRILRKHIHQLGYDRSFVIYDMADQQLLMKKVLEDLLIDAKQFNPKAILNFISGAKNELVGPEEYGKFATNYFTEKVATCYKRYQHQLQKNNALDFDDIIAKTVELFRQYPEILDQYQEQFRYISVDEYQDTNHAQYVLTNLLASKYHNLCVIGDSDQSIYSFRGANIHNILNFEKDYPEAKVVYLEQNYRSTQTILDAAHNVIVKNTQRKDKKLWTERQGGEKITLKTVSNEREEGDFIAKTVLSKLSSMEEKDYRHFVVLYRTNAQSRVLEEAFLRNGIPYKIIGGIKFYERKEIKDLVAYLRTVQNPNDSISLLRIINTPPRKIGQKTIDTIQGYAVDHDLSFWQALTQIDQIEAIRGSKSKALEDFTNLIKDFQKINQEFTASGLIKHILELSGYKRFLDDGTTEGESRLQNVYELISVSGKYDKLQAGESLAIFLEEISLIADIDKLDEQDNAVTLMTIHSAKGLEFPTVFLVGLEDGIFPHSRSLLERNELEEERRLMYVALTRAKDKLFLLHARNRMLYGDSQSNPPSQFIKDLPEDLMEKEEGQYESKLKFNLEKFLSGSNSVRPIPAEDNQDDGPRLIPEQPQFSDESPALQIGDRVSHQTFGEGEILEIKGGVATIRFDSIRYGTKKLALSIAPLKRL